MRRPAMRASTLRRASTAGNRGVARQADAERLDHRGHRRGGAHGHAVAVRAVHARSRPRGTRPASSCRRAAPPTSTTTLVPEPMSLPRYLPVSIGPPETTIVGRSTLAAPISSDGRGLVAADQQHDAVERVGADRLLDVHARRGCGRASRSGRSSVSPSDITGNSSGKPPASQHAAPARARRARGSARCTASAPTRCCRCR